jgi:hypothetical protein
VNAAQRHENDARILDVCFYALTAVSADTVENIREVIGGAAVYCVF